MRWSLLILLPLIIITPSLAKPAREKDVKEELQGIAQEIKEKKQLLRYTAKTEEKVSTELSRIQRNLKDKEVKLKVLDNDLRNVETNIHRASAEMEAVKADVEQRRHHIERRLVSLYKSGEMGTARIIFSSDSFSEMIENLRYMRAVLDSDRKAISAYDARLEQLDGLKSVFEREAKRKEKVFKTVQHQKQEAQAEQRKKTAVLSQVREDKKAYQLSLRELEANAKRLQTMVERLEALQRKSYSEKIDKSGRGSKRAETPAFAGRGFKGQKGRLSHPVKGAIIEGFGKHKHQDFNAYTLSNGISFSAPAGTEIHAVYEGKVIYADYFRGYGNMVILDHGEGFYSLYAHASRISKPVGTAVSKNEILGNVGDVDSARGSMLYFELRHQGKPVNPLPWFR